VEKEAFRGLGLMKIVPWSYVSSWTCYGCGDICCSSSVIPLTTREWLRIVKSFGFECVETSPTGFYLKKTPEEKCIFQYEYMGKHLCAIQPIKPRACKLWPFKVYRKPLYGLAEKAAFYYGGEIFYVYLDTKCAGISYGKPSKHFIRNVIPEFIEVALGTREEQVYSTAPLNVRPKITTLAYF